MQEHNIKEFRELIPASQQFNKSFLQPLYVDLHPDDDFKAVGIHLGFRIGIHYLLEYLSNLKSIGMNHVAINLRFNTLNIERTMDILAERLFPHFHK